MMLSPDTQLGQHGHQLDAPLGQAVARFLLVVGICGPYEHALLHQALEAIGKDVRGNALGGLPQQLPEVAPVRENDVPQYQKAPLVAEYLEGEVDRASRAPIGVRVCEFGHWLHFKISLCILQPVAKCNQLIKETSMAIGNS